jgi:protein-S-isoprenylcysteine O-methyltransferase Ste14
MRAFAAGFFAPWIIYASMLLLHLALPARKVEGYVRDESTGRLLRYRLNGPLVLAAVVAAWAVVGGTGALDWDWLYTHRWSSLIGSCVLGVIFSVAMVLRAPRTGRSLAADLYFGRWLNRQFFRGRVDAKMFLYLIGAAMLALNLLAFTAHHILTFPGAFSPGLVVYCALFLWFVTEYLVFERVHLYTYDIFAERLGLKLGWGCFAFYPYFYLVGLWATAGRPDAGTSTWALIVYAAVFFVGWVFTRGANLQKYWFKTQPGRPFLGFMEPEAISDGENSLLCGGFWSVSRHVNYLGEIVQAVGLTLLLGYPGAWVAWLYPLYYVALFLARERADERRCAAKYGDLWADYTERVPRRIVPWLY